MGLHSLFHFGHLLEEPSLNERVLAGLSAAHHLQAARPVAGHFGVGHHLGHMVSPPNLVCFFDLY